MTAFGETRGEGVDGPKWGRQEIIHPSLLLNATGHMCGIDTFNEDGTADGNRRLTLLAGDGQTLLPAICRRYTDNTIEYHP